MTAKTESVQVTPFADFLGALRERVNEIVAAETAENGCFRGKTQTVALRDAGLSFWYSQLRRFGDQRR